MGYLSSFQGQWRKVDHYVWNISPVPLIPLEDERVGSHLGG